MSEDQHESIEDATIVQLRALEHHRCAAISAGDLAGLADLLHPDLVHTHVTGRTQTKADYLAGLKDRPRRTTRLSLSVRVYGDMAIMTGSLRNVAPGRDEGSATTDITALQVWLRSGQAWQMLAFMATRPVP